MTSKARKRHKRDFPERTFTFRTAPDEPPRELVSVHRTGDQVQRIEFNFGLILAHYGAQLHGVDMAEDRVILHCQADSQANYPLANARMIENLVDTGLIPGETSVPGEAPSPTPSESTVEPKVGEGAESGKPKMEPMSHEDFIKWATFS